MSATDELLEAVRARTRGTAYAVAPTRTGFDVAIDTSDVSWRASAYQQHVSSTWIYHVKVDEAAKTLAITDDVRDLRWGAGIGSDGGGPVIKLSMSASRNVGRFVGKGFQKTFAVNEAGEFGKVGDVTFAAGEGRDLIRGPARDLGWQEQMGTSQRIGVIVAVVTGVLLVLAGMAVLLAYLTGHL